MIFHSSSAAASYDISAVSLDAGQMRIPVAAGPYNEIQGVVSPDTRWIAFASDESGRYEIYLQEFPAPKRRVIVSTHGGTQPRWRRDGQELFYLQADGTLISVAVRTKPQLDVAAPKPLFKTAIATTVNPYRMDYLPDGAGARFLMKIPAGGPTQPVITVVLNWPALLRR